MQIAQDYNITTAALNSHRQGGHAGKALTAMVLQAGNRPELAQLASIAISSKAYRVAELQALYDRCKLEIFDTKVGDLDTRFIKEAVNCLTTAAKEMGDWVPAKSGDGECEGEQRVQVLQIVHDGGNGAVMVEPQRPTSNGFRPLPSSVIIDAETED